MNIFNTYLNKIKSSVLKNQKELYIKMFTGIAEGKGVITAIEKNDDIVSVEVKHSLNNNDISVNDSICCSGICLTVIKQNSFSFKVEMVPETIKRSTVSTCP